MRSIGEVLTVLKPEFHDISISKIRFLEAEGLVTPQRTKAGYRKFSDSDVERLRYILRQQRDNFLPLRVIKDRLSTTDHIAQDSPEIDRSQDQSQSQSQSQSTASMPTGPLSRSQLVEASGLTESKLRDLEQFGLIRGEHTATGLWYDGQSLGIARLAARFLHFGVEPRHLRIFRTSSDREADLYKQLIVPNARNAEAETENRARIEELTRLGAALHDELLREALDK